MGKLDVFHFCTYISDECEAKYLKWDCLNSSILESGASGERQFSLSNIVLCSLTLVEEVFLLW
jgi:hypothetical protein